MSGTADKGGLELVLEAPTRKGGRHTARFSYGDGKLYRAKLDPDDADEREPLARRLAEMHLGDGSASQAGAVEALARQIDQEILQQWRRQQGDTPAAKALTQAEQLLELADGQDYFTCPDGRAYATVTVDDDSPRRETLPLRGKDFRNWLCRRYYHATRKAASVKTLQDVLGVLEARARYDGTTQPVYCRVGGEGTAIYLDLCDSRRRAIEITAGGWRVDAPPVRFRRARGMLPLPEPAAGGDLSALRNLLNVRSEDWPLVVAWLAAALRPTGPYPILCLHGEQGSAKSTAARVLRRLIDPSLADLRAEPRDERDLVISASNSWVAALDNLSHLEPWLSDALCRLSTGGGFATRELYSDSDEAIFDVQRPVILTGIEDLASRPDLMDRAVVLRLPVIEEEDRLPETVYWGRVDRLLPRTLGALLTIVSDALRERPRVRLRRLPRMADFALWGAAATIACGQPASVFLDAYEENRAEAVGLTLDNSPVVGPLRLFMDSPDRLRGRWEGTCQELLGHLEQLNAADPPKGFPRTARGLSGILQRLAPALRRTGIDITHLPRSREGRRLQIAFALPGLVTVVTVVTVEGGLIPLRPANAT